MSGVSSISSIPSISDLVLRIVFVVLVVLVVSVVLPPLQYQATQPRQRVASSHIIVVLILVQLID